MYKFLISGLLFFPYCFSANAQSKSFSDPAQMYNRLLLEKDNLTSKVGNYTVKGTPYLYGGGIKGKLFIHNENAIEVLISYNTYEGALEYANTSTSGSILLQPTVTVDSFLINKNQDLKIDNDLFFVSNKELYSTENGYYQVLYTGEKYGLYKKYKSTLGIVSTNYVQSDLREYQLDVEYYYLNKEVNVLKKLKTSFSSLKKEFKDKMVLDEVVKPDELIAAQESSLILIFQALNK